MCVRSIRMCSCMRSRSRIRIIIHGRTRIRMISQLIMSRCIRMAIRIRLGIGILGRSMCCQNTRCGHRARNSLSVIKSYSHRLWAS